MSGSANLPSHGSFFASMPSAQQSETWKGPNDPLRVVNIVDEAPDVKTFTFFASSQSGFSYKAGQYVTLDLPTDGGPLSRTYTISSAPSRPMSLSITVKAQRGSVGTRWMFENLRHGSTIKAVGPTGRFTLDLAGGEELLFISAGSGIIPMISMLRWLSDVEPSARVAFIHCARSPSDIIFRE